MNHRPAPVDFVVVTGAGGGIGRGLVQALHAAGCAVIATDRGQAPADLPCSLWLSVDLARTVRDPDHAASVFAAIATHVGATPGGRLNALVNNAALQVLGGVDGLSRDDWHQTLDVNLLAPFLWAQGLLPLLQAGQGSVVNISSIHARQTKAAFVAYATSKAALSGMTRAMAVDLGGRVRVNAVEPAAIDTAMLQAGFAGQPEALARLNACHPVGRIGQPAEVAAAVRYLISPEAGFLNGACLALDGGISGRLHDPA